MRRFLVLVLFAPLVLAQTADKPMLGFSAASAAKEQALEAQFDSKLNRDELREWLKRLSARPHHLGSAYDKQNAEFIASLLKSWGYDTNIEEFTVLFPTPKSRVVELIAPEKYTLKLRSQAERRVHRLAAQVVGLRHQHRRVHRALPHAEEPRGGAHRAGEVHVETPISSRTQSSSPRCSSRGATTPTSKSSPCSSPRRRAAWWSSSRRRSTR